MSPSAKSQPMAGITNQPVAESATNTKKKKRTKARSNTSVTVAALEPEAGPTSEPEAVAELELEPGHEAELESELETESEAESVSESIISESESESESASESEQTAEPKAKKNVQETNSFFKSIVGIVILLAVLYNFHYSGKQKIVKSKSKEDIKIDMNKIYELNRKYPNSLSPKGFRTVSSRLNVMLRDVSVLVLLGKQKDPNCEYDATFCVAQTIANVTQIQFGYLDSSDPYISPEGIENELRSLDGSRHTILIDNLEKLPGNMVMNLFQYIDKDENMSDQRRGMLLFIVYTESENNFNHNLKEADVVENILTKKWSSHIARDSLTSVISRISGSIVKVY